MRAVRLAALLLLCAAPVDGQSLLDRIDALPSATVTVDATRHQLIIALPLADVPAGGMVLTPVYRAAVPFDVALHAFETEVVDEAGRPVPRDRLHHVTVTDPMRRGPMLPIVLPIFGASKESPSPRLPRYLFGLPLPAGNRYLTGAMLVNPDRVPRHMQVRVRLSFLRPGRIFPLFPVYPFHMDVTFPLGGEGGRHDFDLPPGRSHRHWQGSPAIAGSIIGMGAHAHDYATLLSLVDVTTGDTLWQQRPVLDAAGRVVRIPVTFFARWYRLGLRLRPTHVYRVSVEYDNPTGATIPYGGMGSIIGLMVPDRKAPWPVANLADPTFATSLRNLVDNMADVPMEPHGRHEH